MANKMMRVNSSTAGRNVTEQRVCVGKINGKPVYNNFAVIEGTRHMIRNSVMNGVHYNGKVFDELAEKLMTSNVRLPAPISHPSDVDGNFVSAKDPISAAHNVGAFDTDWRVENDDLLVSNTYINLDMLKGNESAAWLLERINAKQPIDRSTGLLLDIIAKNGVAADGEQYEYDINRIVDLDHSAILNPDLEPGAKNNSEGVGMFCNASGKCEIEEAEITNAISAAKGLPVASKGYKWDADAAVSRLREYTDSKEKPSTNYRKFFAYFDSENVGDFSAYKLPFADIIDGKPHAVPAALNAISAALGGARGGVDIPEEAKGQAAAIVEHYKDKKPAPTTNALKKALNHLQSLLFGSSGGYNNDDSTFVTNINEDEADAMREELIKRLKNMGYKSNMDDMSDAELMNAFEKMAKGKPEPKAEEEKPAKNAEEIAQAINSALQPLTDEITSLKSQLAANSDKEKGELVDYVTKQVKGMTKEAANALSVDHLKSLAAEHGHIAFNGAGGNPQPEQFEVQMPETGEKY